MLWNFYRCEGFRGISTPNSLKAHTLCFCPPNSHPLAIMEEGASCAPHPAVPVKCRLLPRRRPGSPWGQHCTAFSLQCPPQVSWTGETYMAHCVCFSLGLRFLGTILSLPELCYVTHGWNTFLSPQPSSQRHCLRQWREDHAYHTDGVNWFPFRVSHVCFNWYIINVHSTQRQPVCSLMNCF